MTILEEQLSTVLVTGGSGGLASQILQLFSQRGCAHLHSIDLRQPFHRLENVTYHVADLTDSAVIRRIFDDVRPDVVIHTASPKFDAPMDIMYKVNVEGTKILLQIAKESGTKSFVYTSSASVISDAKTDLKGADETFPLIPSDEQPEFYVHTKVSGPPAVRPACLLLTMYRPSQRRMFYRRTEHQTLHTFSLALYVPLASSVSATWLSSLVFLMLISEARLGCRLAQIRISLTSLKTRMFHMPITLLL